MIQSKDLGNPCISVKTLNFVYFPHDRVLNWQNYIDFKQWFFADQTIIWSYAVNVKMDVNKWKMTTKVFCWCDEINAVSIVLHTITLVMSSCKESVIIYVKTIRNDIRKHESPYNSREFWVFVLKIVIIKWITWDSLLAQYLVFQDLTKDFCHWFLNYVIHIRKTTFVCKIILLLPSKQQNRFIYPFDEMERLHSLVDTKNY